MLFFAVAPSVQGGGKPPLTPCGAGLCGTLTVPVDRSAPNGSTIPIQFEVIPAERPAYRGRQALVLLNGGPGSPARDMSSFAMSHFYDVWQTHDILLFDQRGTGTDRLYCPSPGTVGYDSPAAAVTVYWTTCLKTLGVDPNTYTTAVTMHDLDDVRAALGYQKLDLYGISYGATAAQYYLLMYPEHVRTAILDAGSRLDTPTFEHWGQNAQRVLDALFARCAKDASCHKAFPAPAKDLRTVLARLAQSPATVNGWRITAPAFAFAVQALSDQPDTAAALPFLLHRATTRGVGLVASEVELRTYLPTVQLMTWAILCGEPWARFDPARLAAFDAGSYLAAADAAVFGFTRATCAAFPPYHDVAGAEGPVRSNVPALWLVGSSDPLSPLRDVAGVNAAMPNAKVVVVHGAGHGSLDVGCTTTIANTFVLRGTIKSINTSCATKTPYPGFRLR